MQDGALHPMTREEFMTYLKRHKYRATTQRLAVHDAMLELGHACADMVTSHIHKNSDVKVTVASVYNILTNLAENGVYTRRLSSNNKMYFDVNNFVHAHIYDCVNNSYKDLLDDSLMSLVNEKLGKKKIKGYKIDHVDIQIVCRPSRRKKTSL